MSPRSILLPLSSIMTALFLLGCPLLKKKEDDKTVDAAATGLGAKNEASVLRYERETPIDKEPAVIGADGAKVRTFPGNGPEVAVLAKGAAVTKLAQYFATGTLILFDDPSGDGTKLMGWVTPQAFDTTAPKPATKPTIPSVIRVADAGAAAAKDAGVHDAGGPAPATKDAGTTPVAVVDAGGGGGGASNAAPPQPAKGTVAVPPDAKGRCPDGWVIAPDMCRHKCTADSECPRNTKCTMKGNQKVCSSDH